MTTASQDLITKVRTLIDERTQSSGGVQDVDIIDWFNVVLEDAANLEAFEADPANLALLAGTASYAVPADFVLPRVVVLNGKGLVKASLETILAADKDPAATGTPTHFYLLNNKVYPWPVPVEAATAKLYYYRLPTFFSLDGSGAITPAAPDLPRTAYQALVYCALAHYLGQQAEGDMRAAEGTVTLYDRRLATLVRAVRKARRSSVATFRSSTADERWW